MGEIFRQDHAGEASFEPDDARIGRLHRLYLARQFAHGRDVIVLGDTPSAVLTEVARHVAAGPVNTDHNSADLVIAYTQLARQPYPAAYLTQLRSLVRQGGTLLLDAPAGAALAANARHQFDAGSLAALARTQFAHVRVWRQRGLIGSAMLSEIATSSDATTLPTVFAHRGPLHVEVTTGLPQADTLLCIASDTPITIPDSLFIDKELAALAHVQGRAAQAQFELNALRTEHAALTTQTSERHRSDAAWRYELAVLRVNEAAAQSAAASLTAERDAALHHAVQISVRLEQTERAAAAHAARLAAECARLRALPPPPTALSRLRRRLGALRNTAAARDRPRMQQIAASALFDRAWYLDHYPDVRAAGLDPVLHYLRHGAAEARDPGPAFNAVWYASQHPDLSASGLSTVEHYERHGRAAGWPTQPPELVASAAPAPAPRPPNPRVLFISGEPDTPGSQYRCVRYAQAAAAAGWSAGWSRIEHTGAIELVGVEIAVLWRVRYSEHVAGIIREIRQAGGTVVFDIDDLMIKPEFATTRIIDGIRTTNAGIGSTRETFAQVQQAMIQADLCTTTTEELARHMRDWQKATYILPNGYDDATLVRSRRAVRARVANTPQLGMADAYVRIGYAAGTLTHQRDFAVALPGLLRVLKSRDHVRLVLFRATGGPDLVLIEEFEELVAYADRIEWRDSVELAALPNELARMDINIAPLELGNPFCEAKSELKYFEAALVSIPTVASPSGPFARAIRHEHTGMLAEDDEAWHQSLLRLVDDAGFRCAIGRRAYIDCIWQFGPQRRAQLVHAFLQQITGTAAGARDFALDIRLQRERDGNTASAISFTPAERLFYVDRLEDAQVTVVVPCYNYAEFIVEALESVRAQSLKLLDLIVIDDCSTDPLTRELIVQWATHHQDRFNRLLVLKHVENAGLSAARNTGFEAAETPFVMPLDADNRLGPRCCEALLEKLATTDAAFAYGSVKMFGAADGVFCNERYQPVRFIGGNYIDAMALVAKWAWAAAGGYAMPRHMGWEDFDLWCRLAELGQRGEHVDQVLAEYRVHDASMVSSVVEVEENKQRMVALIETRHPWLSLSSRRPYQRV